MELFELAIDAPAVRLAVELKLKELLMPGLKVILEVALVFELGVDKVPLLMLGP